MAKLSAHGKELDRREYHSSRVAVMEDGAILRNDGSGWKLWARVAKGTTPREAALAARKKYDARPVEYRAYVKALARCCALSERANLHALIELMPSDPDGCCAMLGGRTADALDLEDISAACEAYIKLERVMRGQKRAA